MNDNPQAGINYLRLALVPLVVLFILAAIWAIMDLKLFHLFSLLFLVGLVWMFFQGEAVLYMLPLAFILPNRGMDIPGPFAVEMWDTMVGFLVSGAIVRAILERKSLLTIDAWFRRLILLFIGIAAVSLLQALWYADGLFLRGFKEVVRLVELSLFLVVLVDVLDTSRKIYLLARNLVIASAVFLGTALAGHFLITDLFYYLLGLTKTYVLIGSYLLRMASTAGDVAATGTFLLVSLALVLFFIRNGSEKGSRFFSACLFIALLVGILLTYNKGTWQAALLGSILILTRTKMRMRNIFLAFMILSFFSILIFYQVQIHDPVNVIVTDLSNVVVSSGTIRLVRWLAIFKVLLVHPILGVGYNCFAYVYGQYAVEIAAPLYGHPHNMYIDVMAGTGLLGFTVFIMWIIRILRISAKNMLQSPEPLMLKLSFYIHLGLWFFLAGNLTASFLFKPGHAAYQFVALVAMVLAIQRLRKKSEWSLIPGRESS